MHVFVAGATGVIGSRLVPLLLRAGHTVSAITRSPEAAARLRADSVEATVCDVFDAQGLRKSLEAARPEVVVSQLTAIPGELNPRRIRREMAATNRLRTEGTELLLDVARAAGTRRAIVQSIAFLYYPEGTRYADEHEPLYTSCPRPFRDMAAAVARTERLARTSGMESIVLRYGYFYGPGSIYDHAGSFARAVRRRRVPIVGNGRGTFSFIHVDDAARATLQAVEGGPSGIYNVVDDDPAMVAEWLPHYAQVLGAPSPISVPEIVGRLAAGPYGTYLMCRQRGAYNWRAKEHLSWRPFHSSWRTGFEWELIPNPDDTNARRRQEP